MTPTRFVGVIRTNDCCSSASVLAAEAPTILTPPEERRVVAEGTSINISCEVVGKPDPIITWFKDEQQITGGRYHIQLTGNLTIRVGTRGPRGTSPSGYRYQGLTGNLIIRV